MLLLITVTTLALGACGAEPTTVSSATSSGAGKQQPAVSPLIPPSKAPQITVEPVTSSAAAKTTAQATTLAPIIDISGGSSNSNPSLTVLANAQVAYLQAGDLWVADDKGGNRRQLTRGANLTSDKIYWSPTHDKVAVFEKRDGITLYELTGQRTTLFRPDPLVHTLNNAGWSPDGRYLAFDMIVASRSGNTTQPISLYTDGDIYVVDTQSPQQSASAGGPSPAYAQRVAGGFNFAWSPDGKQLAYATRARRLEVVDLTAPTNSFYGTNPTGSVTPASSGVPGTGTPNKVIGNAGATTAAGATTQPPVPTPSQFPIIRPGRNTTSTPKPGALVTPTPNPYYNAPQAVVPFENGLAVMNVTDRRENVLFTSLQLPPYPSPDGNVYPTGGTAIQIVSWSPDGRNLAFGDKFSYVGLASYPNGSTRMLFGQPRAFRLQSLLWVPNSTNSLSMLWQNFPGDDSSLFGLLNSPGVMGSAISDSIGCPAISPTGQHLAYFDGKDTVIMKLDGAMVGTVVDGSCPSWSPDGSQLITSQQGKDGAIIIANIYGQVTRQLLSLRAVDQVFWFRPN